MNPWLSIVVPTAGKRRDGLLRTLASIQHQPKGMRDGVEVLVVADTNGVGDPYAFEVLHADVYESGLHARWLEHDAGIHCYGQPQRQYGARCAQGEWVAFSQDDDILAEGALAQIWMALCTEPRKRPLFFKTLMHWGAAVWDTPQLYLSNIDADCLVLPRALAQEVNWGMRYEGDFDAAVDAMQRAQGDVGWRVETIAIARPEAVWW